MRLQILITAAIALVLAAPAFAQQGGRNVQVFKGDPVVGKLKAEDERCQECHGHDGNANDIEDGIGNIGKFPRLAGQLPSYLMKQIRDFRSGVRQNDNMFIMVRSLNDRDAADILAYFSRQKVASEIGDKKGGGAALGRQLFAQGDAARGIPACAGCHGEAGQGQQVGDASYPRLAGQHRRYITKQLSEWRAGERKNSQGGVMNVITRQLTDNDIDQLAAYVAGL
jgi:cytochrome c553